ncbi:MAG: HRDC domain-containing protein [Bacteroidia bacterium]|nr:HRDC domain-containing protein [Bacteroidota bacterium]
MKIKVFHIRLSKDKLQADQDLVNDFLDRVKVIKIATELINGQTNFWSILVFFENRKSGNISDKISYNIASELNSEEEEIFDTLKKWRHDKAAQLNIPSFIICQNTELITIAKEKPTTLNDLLRIKGFGANKISKFGDDIIAILNSI